MARVFSSAKTLERGEQQLLRLFQARLENSWEVYVQPYLNGLRPDFVLLHPRVGIGVFEVKDWTLEGGRYAIRNGRVFIAEGGGLEEETRNPLDQLALYRDEITRLYCPRLGHGSGIAAVRAALVYTRAALEAVHSLHAQLKRDTRDEPGSTYLTCVGKEALESGDIGLIFPETQHRHASRIMSEDLAEDLRMWLRPPHEVKLASTPLVLDTDQRRLATTRTELGHRRIKGPAGAGKSLVAAARAVEIAKTARRVLVVSYNITLAAYLRALAVRYYPKMHELDEQPHFLHFHAWCKRVCFQSGARDDYFRLWADRDTKDGEDVLEVDLPQLVLQCLRRSTLAPTYDAVIVDEGQDFRLLWWTALASAVRMAGGRGEMMLVADKTQNIYGTAKTWTESVMSGAGFRGAWSQLRGSHRLPGRVAELASAFAGEFMGNEEVDLPSADTLPWDVPTSCCWFQVDRPEDMIPAACVLLQRLLAQLPHDMAEADVCYLAQTMHSGKQIAERLEAQGIRVEHTFEAEDRGRGQKLRFRQDRGRIKATTVHSFKGLETRALLIVVEDIDSEHAAALFYTALTRLVRHSEGSVVWVACAVPVMAAYGRTWDEFEQVDARGGMVV